jgi:hypothetical protein
MAPLLNKKITNNEAAYIPILNNNILTYNLSADLQIRSNIPP